MSPGPSFSAGGSASALAQIGNSPGYAPPNAASFAEGSTQPLLLPASVSGEEATPTATRVDGRIFLDGSLKCEVAELAALAEIAKLPLGFRGAELAKRFSAVTTPNNLASVLTLSTGTGIFSLTRAFKNGEVLWLDGYSFALPF